MIPYSLHCTTCRAALRVTDASAIGQILPCPKCGSMVQVVPPLVGDGPAVRSGTADKRGEMPASEISRPGGNEIEQLAAEAVAQLPEHTPAMTATPPPLPRVAISAGVDPIVPTGKPITFLIAAAAASILAVGAVVWALWASLRDDPVPAVAEALGEPVETEQEPGAQPVLSGEVGSGDFGLGESSRAAILEPEASAAAASTQANRDAQPSAVQATSEIVGAANPPRIDAPGDRHVNGSDAAAGPSGSPAAPLDAPANSASPEIQASQEHAARKSALKLEDLPSSNLPDADPVVSQSAGQQTAEDAVRESPSDLLAPPESPTANIRPDTAADPPLPRRNVSNKIDVSKRLATTIAAIDFRDVPLHKALDALSDLGGVSIGLDVDALHAAGVRVDERISVQGKSLTIPDALEHALRPHALIVREQSGHLQVIPAGAGQTRKARYAVDDLVRPGDPPIDELVELVRAVVAERAIEDSSAIAVTAETGAIFLTAPELEHNRMIELCEKLRVARGRPLRTRFNASRPDPRFIPQRFELRTRWAKAQDLLATPVTATVGRPAPLCELVKFLADHAGAIMLIDRSALAAAGLAVDTDARLVVNAEPLEAALGRLLEPLGLAFRVVDDKLLEISTAPAIAKLACIEFYPARGLFAGRAAAAGDFELHRDKLLAAAGISGSKATIMFDAPSECLIVCAAYPEQVLLEQAIGKLERK